MGKSFENLSALDILPQKISLEYTGNRRSFAVLWSSWAFNEEKCFCLWMSRFKKPKKRKGISTSNE